MKPHIGRGDDGRTDLIGGPRVDKDSARIDAAGTIDELNCTLGVALALFSRDPQGSASPDRDKLAPMLEQIMSELFVIGGDLAMPGDSDARGDLVPVVTEADIRRLEGWIGQLSAGLPALHHFILPDGCELAARLHLARAVCRRAERVVVRLARVEPINGQIPVFLNRLSDLLFAAARWANKQAGVADVPWMPPKK
jgi:cob(I)alamin adenosyltransferase